MPELLTIRRTQMDRLGQVAAEVFVEQLADRCFEYHPVPARLAGRPAVLESARRAVAAAIERGYTARIDLSRWYSLILWFGHGFARDPQYSPLQPWLRAESNPATLARLQFAALPLLERITGPDNSYLVRALVRARAANPAGFQAPPEELPERLGAWIAGLWPEKAATLTAAQLRSFADAACRRAKAWSLESPSDVAAFAGVGWFLGVRFDDDPLFPWAAAALGGSAAPRERAEALVAAARHFLDRALAGEPGVPAV